MPLAPNRLCSQFCSARTYGFKEWIRRPDALQRRNAVSMAEAASGRSTARRACELSEEQQGEDADNNGHDV